ncbi:MAG TPA: hypothetical protein PLK31_21085, partial [Chloroflexota bacterium]|nr:hypothetical protein [Chloroflexota bacterium]
MKNGRTLFLFAFLLALLVAASPIQAQNPSYSVPQLYMQVFVNPDASVRIVYDITFDNNLFASPIDIVDIGTPHKGYILSNFEASIDGNPLTDIRKSEYIDVGVEIHLGRHTIQPGQSGTLHVEFTMPDMVYEDVTQDGYASLQITPTWFDETAVMGTSDIWVVYHLLPGIDPDAVLFQDVPFTNKALFEEHTIVGWRWPEGQAIGPYLVGASFPTTGLTRVIEQTLLDLAVKWLEDNPGVAMGLGLAILALLGLAFFRYSGGTGISIFVVLGCGAVWLMMVNPAAILWLCPLSLVLVGLVEYRLAGRKEKYLPAIAQVEGGGIKRGLTAPEAAILLELPLNKVLLLVLFGLLDKGALELVDDDPLQVKVVRPYLAMQADRAARNEQRRKIAQQQGIVLRTYEHQFLDVLQEHEGSPAHKLDFSNAMKSLISSVAGRMKGFDLSDTQDYYRKIIARAMEQANTLGNVPELEEHLDKTWPWVFLDDNYDPSFRRRDYHYYPTWARPYVTPHTALPSGGSVAAPSPGGKTNFSNVAAGFAGWTENTAGRLASAISPTALQVKGVAGGFVNLSGADKVTGDVFKAMMSGSGGSGGSGGSSGGSSCACACAGCA